MHSFKIDDATRKELKKTLLSGMIIAAGEGLILSTTDLNEEHYVMSKKIGGFIHQMPIVLHVRGHGAGQYSEYMNKYLSLSEAKTLWVSLSIVILRILRLNFMVWVTGLLPKKKVSSHE